MPYDPIEIVILAEAARLSGRESLNDYDAVLAQCNGIGAAWFPAWLRRLISCRNPTITTASFIHDRRYCEGGTLLDRLDADLEFGYNSIRLACYKYRLFDPRRYIVVFRALLCTALLLFFGGVAYHYHR